MGVIFRNGKPYGGAASSTDEIYYIDDNGNRITLTEEIEVLKQSCQYDLDSKIDKTEKGSKNGVAELDGTGKVPSDQLPSYVDDVIEGYYNSNNENFYLDEEYTENIKGEEGKIYIDLITNGSYRYAIKSNKFIKITSGYIGGKTDYGTIIIDGNSILLDQAVGMSTESHEYEIEGEVISSKNGAEIFNDYQHNVALGDYSHAEGSETIASGPYSHAEGFGTKAIGNNSHAEGSNTVASGNSSHSEGIHTIASSDYQHAQGRYNVEDAEDKYALIIGNGTSNDNRSNAIAIDWDGNIICYGDEISINEQVDNNTRKLSGIDDNANNYIHPTHTSHSKSMYKFANDVFGHVSDAEKVTKKDITDLGIPGQDTVTTVGVTRNLTSGTKIATITVNDTSYDVYAPTNTDTTYTAGTGLSMSGTTINHKNSVTAKTTVGFLKLKYDAQGHITGSSPVTKKDIVDIGIPADDTNTEYIVLRGLVKTNSGHIGGVSSLLLVDKSNYDKENEVLTSTNDLSICDLDPFVSYMENHYMNPEYIAYPMFYQVEKGGEKSGIQNVISSGKIRINQHLDGFDVDGPITASKFIGANATKTEQGLMSADDKTKLDVIETGANKTVVDAALSSTSTNPVQNKVIKTEFEKYLPLTGGTLTGTLIGTTFIGGLSGNAASATKLQYERNINGLSFNGTADRVNYASCSTAAATAAKEVSCAGFVLVTGAEITVKFTVTNTASSPTLNVGGTGAKPIYYRGAAITPDYLAANRTYTFRYNGTQYDLVGDIDTNTNTDTKVTQSGSTTENYRPLLLGYANSTDTSTLTTSYTNQVYTNTAIYAQPSSGTVYATNFVGDLTGTLSSSTANFITHTANGYKTFFRSDGSDFYILVSDKDGTTWNSYRPFKLNLATGVLDINGNSSTAIKLKTARTINGVSFDGSDNIKIGLDSCRSYSPSSNYASYPWFKIASVSATTTSNNYNLTLYVSKGYGTGVTSGDGILKVYFRTSSTAGKVENCTLKWQFASSSGGTVGINPDNFVMVYTNDTTNGKATAELWVKHTQQWESWHFKVLHSGTHSSNSPSLWTLYNSTSGSASYTSGTGTVVSSFSTLQNGLSDTGWLTLADNVKYRKIGNIVEVRGTYTAPNSGGGMTIGTLPSGYRPSNSSVYNTNSIDSTASNIYYTSVSTAGAVVISGMSGSTFTKDSTYNVNIMFMVG